MHGNITTACEWHDTSKCMASSTWGEPPAPNREEKALMVQFNPGRSGTRRSRGTAGREVTMQQVDAGCQPKRKGPMTCAMEPSRVGQSEVTSSWAALSSARARAQPSRPWPACRASPSAASRPRRVPSGSSSCRNGRSSRCRRCAASRGPRSVRCRALRRVRQRRIPAFRGPGGWISSRGLRSASGLWP